VRWIDQVGVSIDRRADVPVGVQLAWALRGAIRSGALSPGDRLPALRELAEDLGVNPNTLRAVYARLEADELIETRHGSGTYVRSAGSTRDLNDVVDTAARAARDAGVDPRDLAAALYVTPGAPAPARDAEAEQRRRVRDEIDVLEQVLARYPHAPPPTTRSKGPRLLSLAELEAERDGLVARLAAAARPEPEPEAAPAPKRKAKAKAPARGAAKPRLGPATA
jgi:DNA-binding transcriptional regulator YhcF (GntR family)